MRPLRWVGSVRTQLRDSRMRAALMGAGKGHPTLGGVYPWLAAPQWPFQPSV